MMVETFHHRSTLKQQNKRFKSKHATKGTLKDVAKGKVLRQSSKAASTANVAAQLKQNRKNTAKQTQMTKRHALASATRIFNGVDGAPRIVAVIPLTEDANVKAAISCMAESIGVSAQDCPVQGLWKMKAERFKTSVQFQNISYGDFYTALDACKVADYVLFVMSSAVEVNSWGETLLRTLQAQGFPEAVTVLSPNASIDSKTRTAVLKSLLSFIQYFIPSQSKVFDLQNVSESLNSLRSLTEGKPADVRWREGRSYVLGESTEWNEGTLKLTGVVRGSPLSANRLVHLPGFGDYQISKILSAPSSRFEKPHKIVSKELDPIILAEPDTSSADSLVSTNEPDDLANEQTWPTEEETGHENEIQEEIPDADEGTTPKRIRRIPKGMSEYQAAWIVDDDDEEDEGAEREGNSENGIDAPDVQEDEEMEDLITYDDAQDDHDRHEGVRFEDLNVEEEEMQLKKWRNRRREEEDDLAFPDEIDTPQDQDARTRFQRYRGLRSFRASPWDPFENLPRDYARIFQFEDFKRTERGVRRRAEQEEGIIETGTRVTICLKDVPSAAASISSLPLFTLLQHEHKVTVLNFTIQRNTEYDGSVRSKDPLILCVGPRRLSVNPIYSQHTGGGGTGLNNVHRFERYLRHGSTYVATTYGPITYGKLPCFLLRETPDLQAPQLVGMGTFMNPDTTRIIAKKIILTGHPFKVHKKTATVRYMFFNADDIRYFKPIQLHTKYGRSGHIREPLGTHGYFKAHFDGPINQMDTVCMSLYKRVFPKWSSLWSPNSSRSMEPTLPSEISNAMEE